MNSKKPPRKVSNMMRLMNYFLYSVFALQLLMILVLATLSILWRTWNEDKSYTSVDDSGEVSATFWDWCIQILTFWVAYSHMIPISLYVMIEVMKLFQSKLIGSDEELRDKETEAYSEVRNSDLIEELGQVQFVFSDKTGTLTQNKMEFWKFTCDGSMFPDEYEDAATKVKHIF